MFACDVSDVVYNQVIFTTSAGAVIDPTTVVLYLKAPSGSVGTYTYASGAVARIAQGTYAYNGTATQAGYWNSRWVGDGAAVAAEQSRYFVRGTNT